MVDNICLGGLCIEVLRIAHNYINEYILDRFLFQMSLG